jgi:hypothetical protein
MSISDLIVCWKTDTFFISGSGSWTVRNHSFPAASGIGQPRALSFVRPSICFKHIFEKEFSTAKVQNLAGETEFWRDLVFKGLWHSRESNGLNDLCSENFVSLQRIIHMSPDLIPSNRTSWTPEEPEEWLIDPWVKNFRDSVNEFIGNVETGSTSIESWATSPMWAIWETFMGG